MDYYKRDWGINENKEHKVITNIISMYASNISCDIVGTSKSLLNSKDNLKIYSVFSNLGYYFYKNKDNDQDTSTLIFEQIDGEYFSIKISKQSNMSDVKQVIQSKYNIPTSNQIIKQQTDHNIYNEVADNILVSSIDSDQILLFICNDTNKTCLEIFGYKEPKYDLTSFNIRNKLKLILRTNKDINNESIHIHSDSMKIRISNLNHSVNLSSFVFEVDLNKIFYQELSYNNTLSEWIQTSNNEDYLNIFVQIKCALFGMNAVISKPFEFKSTLISNPFENKMVTFLQDLQVYCRTKLLRLEARIMKIMRYQVKINEHLLVTVVQYRYKYHSH